MKILDFLAHLKCGFLKKVEEDFKVTQTQILQLIFLIFSQTSTLRSYFLFVNLPDYFLGAFLDGGGPYPPKHNER